MVLLIKDNKALPYPDIWKRVLETNKELKWEYQNVLHVFKILFAMPITNWKVKNVKGQI